MWESCWSTARFSLRLTDQQFGELTPRQYYLLLDRHREAAELNKTLFGVVAAAVANFGPREIKRHLTPADFVGGSGSATAESSRATEKERLERSRAALMAMAGR